LNALALRKPQAAYSNDPEQRVLGRERLNGMSTQLAPIGQELPVTTVA
jgi:hypothetical protein